MIPGPDAQRIKAQLMVWWIVWSGVLGALLGVYLLLGRGAAGPAPTGGLVVNLVGFVPLFVSIVIRWLVLPRYDESRGAFVMFVVGLSLAEACGLLGIFLGGPYRDPLVVLAVLGVTQYAPFYARRFFEPRGSGFIPNN